MEKLAFIFGTRRSDTVSYRVDEEFCTVTLSSRAPGTRYLNCRLQTESKGKNYNKPNRTTMRRICALARRKLSGPSMMYPFQMARSLPKPTPHAQLLRIHVPNYAFLRPSAAAAAAADTLFTCTAWVAAARVVDAAANHPLAVTLLVVHLDVVVRASHLLPHHLSSLARRGGVQAVAGSCRCGRKHPRTPS